MENLLNRQSKGSTQFENLWDGKNEEYNKIFIYLEKLGLDESQLLQCSLLIYSYETSLVSLNEFLYKHKLSDLLKSSVKQSA